MIFQDHIPDLFNLVRFPLPILGLQVEDLLNTILGENVVVAFNALIKPKSPEQSTQRFERDVCV